MFILILYLIAFDTLVVSRAQTTDLTEDFGLIEEEATEVTALGRIAELGELYDAKTDRFLTYNMFNVTRLPATQIISTQANFTQLTFTNTYSFEERFAKLDISAQFKLSILFGMCEISGSGHFMRDTQKSAKVEKASLIQKMTTIKEHISISDASLKPFVNYDVFGQEGATHMVVGIQWGGDIYVSVENSEYDSRDHRETGGSLSGSIQLAIGSISSSTHMEISEKDKNAMSKFKIQIFGDVLPSSLPQTFMETLTFMKMTPSLLKQANNGKGKPMKYTLLPISTIKKVWKSSIMIGSLVNKIDNAIVEDCVKIFDKMTKTEQKINDLATEIDNYSEFIINERVEDIIKIQKNFLHFQANMTKLFSEVLIDIRSGKIDQKSLNKIIEEVSTNCYNIENVELPKFEDVEKEILFIIELQSLNVTFLGKRNSLDKLMIKNHDVDIYVLKYKSNFNETDRVIFKNFREMISQRTFYGSRTIFSAINFAFQAGTIQAAPAKISLYKNEVLIRDNFEPTRYNQFVWKTIHSPGDIVLDEIISGTYGYSIAPQIDSVYVYFPSRIYFNENLFFMAMGSTKSKIVFFDYVSAGKVLSTNTTIPSTKITVNGNVVASGHYEILTNPHNVPYKYVKTAHGEIPSHAVVCGVELGEVFYCGRIGAKYTSFSAIIPAKISNGTAYGAFFTHQKTSDYEYLVYNDLKPDSYYETELIIDQEQLLN